MKESEQTSGTGGFDQTAHNALRLALIFLVLYWCLQLLAPFIPLVVWGAIIAVAIYPLHEKLAVRLGNRVKLSATLIALLGLTILIAPVIVLTESLVESSTDLAAHVAEGSVRVPPPPERVKDIPLVGDKLHSNWLLASQNLSATSKRFGPQLKTLRESLIATATSAGAAFLQILFSVIIAGVFLATKDKSVAGVRLAITWLVGERGPVLISASEATVRSVARGVLGVAVIETVLAAIGLVAADVPAAGFWTLLILVLSIVQVPPLLVVAPLVVYVLSTAEAIGAGIFVVCGVLVVATDTFVKPLLLGRGANVPMLVILMGAIGGMILLGIVGLFVGAVVLVLGWELLQFWFKEVDSPASEPPGEPQLPAE